MFRNLIGVRVCKPRRCVISSALFEGMTDIVALWQPFDIPTYEANTGGTGCARFLDVRLDPIGRFVAAVVQFDCGHHGGVFRHTTKSKLMRLIRFNHPRALKPFFTAITRDSCTCAKTMCSGKAVTSR